MGRTIEQQREAVSIRRRVLSLPTLLSFAVATAFILFLVTRLDLDWAAMWGNIRRMNPWLYGAGFLSYYASFIFRGLRWRMLARNAGIERLPDGRLPSAAEAAQFILIGWFVNSVTWLRLGDAYRAYLLSEKSKGGFSWSLGTILAERVIDMATIFTILVASVTLLAATSSTGGTGRVLLAAALMALALLVLMLLMRRYGIRLARVLPGRLEDAYHRFHQGTMGSFKQLPLLFLLGFAGWTAEIGRLYFIIAALGLDAATFFVPIVALGHAILSSVPTPGGIGAVEPGVTGLLLLRFGRVEAVSIALVDRTITYLSVVLVGGLVFLLRQTLTMRRHYREASAVRGGRNHEPAAD